MKWYKRLIRPFIQFVVVNTHMGNDMEEMDTGSVQSQYLLISAAFDRKEAGPEQRPFA